MDLTISQMQQMQQDLFERNKDLWPPKAPEQGRTFILYMVEEIGEAIAILKKRGDREVVTNAAVREAFLEEMADVLMYYNEVLLRYHIIPEEISSAYTNKHLRNMGRNYAQEYKELYQDG